jgi:site-specific DNA-methyltransferase (adenine-specific)
MKTLGPYALNSIITGDARELAGAIPDSSVDLVLTDPPFGIGFKYSNGYQDDPAQYEDLIKWVISESERVAKPGGLCFVFVAQLRLRHIWSLFPEDSKIFVGAKNYTQIYPQAVQNAYDPVIYWQKPGKDVVGHTGRDWYIGNTNPMSFKGQNKLKWHSCPRPLDTIIYMVENFSPPAGLVIDWFMGSGTTALAAKILGRSYWGCEIDPATAASARQRVEMTQPPLFVMQPEQAVMSL